MKNIESKLLQLKDKLESTAFLVSKNGSEKQVHSEIVQSLVILSEVLQFITMGNNRQDKTIYSHNKKKYSVSDATNSKEINKVSNRLGLWAKRQNQLNSRILNAFLKLERSGVSVITESALRNELPEVSTFESNFAQMKVIAENNHGKVFEQYGDEVTLWEPIIPYVREYEKVIRKSY
jgi:hypothetical protein